MAENKSKVGVLVGLLGLLVVVLIVAIYMLLDIRKELNSVSRELAEKTEFFKMEKDSLERELRTIYFQYDSLETDNVTIQKEMKLQQEKIERLLALQADDAYKIKMYKREMETLRSVLRSYIVQIDSLNLKNQALMAENLQLKNVERKLQTEKTQLQEDKAQLEELKDMAVTLQASDIALFLLNKRDNETRRLRTAEIIRVDFILRANQVATPGEKTIFMRIIRPDTIVLASSELEMLEINGEQIPATASRTVNYENSDLPVAIYWTINGELSPGEYKVELYLDGRMIGLSSFLLK
ncbi:MAG: hypothetical protein JXR52_09565 [Bacteroidales bacterium]|nr:hypothetical protein [Bacteroidales bacterium]MBN2699064.1 hypothetical protein [Bacteroidales bacterium]